jgi:hypothetical protein
MKKIFLSLSIIILSISSNYAQQQNIDSLKKAKKVETIRKNVQEFFTKQHKRFSYQLKEFKQQFALYFTPQYFYNGILDLYQPNKNLNLLDLKPEDIFRPLNYYKPTCFEKPLNVPQKVIDYAEMLLRRAYGNWCEEKFGYKNLEYGDEFGILLILSPKDIPDSLNALKVTYYVPSDYEAASEDKKRMMDLFVKLTNYYFMGEGLNERFITVTLKY